MLIYVILKDSATSLLPVIKDMIVLYNFWLKMVRMSSFIVREKTETILYTGLSLAVMTTRLSFLSRKVQMLIYVIL